MNYPIRHCAFVISALLIGVSAIDLNNPAQARPYRPGTIDQSAAMEAGAGKIAEAGAMNLRAEQSRPTRNLAYAALTQCYTYNNLKACSQLPRIKNTLFNWCLQNEQNSCTAFKTVVDYESLK